MISYVRDSLTRLGVLASRPTAFFVVVTYGALWFLFARDTFDWHAVATLATWMMTVFIQRAEHRDTQALHAKLDHLLDRLDDADGKMARIDRMQPEDIEQFREGRLPRRRLHVVFSNRASPMCSSCHTAERTPLSGRYGSACSIGCQGAGLASYLSGATDGPAEKTDYAYSQSRQRSNYGCGDQRRDCQAAPDQNGHDDHRIIGVHS